MRPKVGRVGEEAVQSLRCAVRPSLPESGSSRMASLSKLRKLDKAGLS